MSVRYQTGSKTAWITFAGNVVLTIMKAVIGFLSGSLAVSSDAAHSASDAVSTILVLLGFHIANKPPDEKHPYGHGRAETIVAKIIALMLILIGANFAYTALKVILRGSYRIPGQSALWVSLFSIAAKELMYRYAYRVGKKIDSPALIADAWHHRSDAISSIAALLGVLLARLGYPIFDPLMTIVVAAILIKVGWSMAFTIIDELMDAQVDSKILKRIKKIVLETENVHALHDLKVHKHGAEYHVHCTISIPADHTIAAGHDLTHLIEKNICSEYSGVTHVHIHLEPHEGV
ncbi:MAG TPA: cation transporter [Firmicutes bacterium]|nr:cation transporter [Bacillota bacterium]